MIRSHFLIFTTIFSFDILPVCHANHELTLGPGALQHVIARGISRQRIFQDDANKNSFLDRLSGLLKDCGINCYAWAILDTHFHLLLRSGAIPISTLMRRLLTSYAISHNLRHVPAVFFAIGPPESCG
jgi:hypothetical protein